jgi:hypothetical protein
MWTTTPHLVGATSQSVGCEDGSSAFEGIAHEGRERSRPRHRRRVGGNRKWISFGVRNNKVEFHPPARAPFVPTWRRRQWGEDRISPQATAKSSKSLGRMMPIRIPHSFGFAVASCSDFRILPPSSKTYSRFASRFGKWSTCPLSQRTSTISTRLARSRPK